MEPISLSMYVDRVVELEADVGGWLNGRDRRRAAMAVVGSSSHAGLDRNPIGAIRDVEVLVSDIRAAAS